MRPGIFFFALLILILLNLSLGQSIDCVYSGNYQCGLILNNPQGFDNFTSIGGNHLENKTNADVKIVSRSSGTSQNFPSIICEQFPNLDYITVTNAEIEILSEKSFAGCLKIKQIEVYNNKIATPPVNLLVNNRDLEWFRIYANNITEPLPVGIFDSTPNITFLCHETNPTGFLLQDIFKGLTKMDALHIYSMQLSELPACLMKSMVDLNHLDADGNQIKILHQKSFPPTKNNLQNFLFNSNQIEAIDRKIFEDTPILANVQLANNICTNFSTSNFYVNREVNLAALERCFAEYDRRFPSNGSVSTCNFIIHEDYGYTCELINFNTSETIVNEIHIDCFSDSDVTGLIFTSTKIDKIPSQIFSIFPNLKFIEAVNVGLETALIENCGENLKFIDVSHNSIRSLPSDSFNCENIEEIIADKNCISSIQSCEKSFMDDLMSLKKISMRKTACVDKEFDFEIRDVSEIKKVMNECFGMWYLR